MNIEQERKKVKRMDINSGHIREFYRAAVPAYAPCPGCESMGPHVLTDGNGRYVCRSCATRAGVAAVVEQFAPVTDRAMVCHVRHGVNFPAVRVEIATGRGFCDKCYSRIIDAVRNGTAE